MIDRHFIEQAGMDAVGCLEEAESDDYVRETRLNPELRRVSAEMRDIVALVAAATTAPAPLPPQALAGIYRRLADPSHQGPTPAHHPTLSRRPRRLWLPWALAAGFALIAGSQAWRNMGNAHRLRNPGGPDSDLSAQGFTHGIPSDDPSFAPATSDPNALENAVTHPGPKPPPRFYLPSDPPLRLQQQNKQLREQLARLYAEKTDADGSPASRSQNLVSINEMVPPGTKRSAEERLTAAERITRAIQSAFEQGGSEPTPQPDAQRSERAVLEITGPGTDDLPDFRGGLPRRSVIEKQLVDNPEQQLRHLEFPPEAEWDDRGLIPLDDTHTRVYDPYGGVLWEFTPGSKYPKSVLPPPGWSPDDMSVQTVPNSFIAQSDDGSGDSTIPGNSTVDSWDNGNPSALPIIWEHEEQSTLLVRNLPALPENEAYHFWMTDESSGLPVLITELPSSLRNFDAILFPTPLTNGGAFLLTREIKGTANKSPSAQVVLESAPEE